MKHKQKVYIFSSGKCWIVSILGFKVIENIQRMREKRRRIEHLLNVTYSTYLHIVVECHRILKINHWKWNRNRKRMSMCVYGTRARKKLNFSSLSDIHLPVSSAVLRVPSWFNTPKSEWNWIKWEEKVLKWRWDERKCLSCLFPVVVRWLVRLPTTHTHTFHIHAFAPYHSSLNI